MSLNTSTNMQQFKQQTFSLIKDQSIKIKTLCKDMEIKQEQIRLLKQTIQALEDQKEQIDRNNLSLKNKIDTILKEVGNYNDTVVHKLWEENDVLKKKLQQLSPALQQNLATVKRLSKKLQTSEQNLQKSTKQLALANQYLIEHRKQLEFIKSEQMKQKQLIGEKDKKINRLQAQNQQQQGKIRAYEKQVDQLVSKCQETASSYEKKMKSMKDSMIRKQQMAKVEQEGQKYKIKCDQQKREVDRMCRQKNELNLQIKILKQKETSIATKNQIEVAILESDIRNMKDSCKVGKKICQFQSKYSEYFYQIVEQLQKIREEKDELEKKLEIHQSRVQQMEKMLNEKQSIIDESKNELEIMAQKLKSQAESIQSSYEGKILQLSIKIKKQERALQELGIKDRQFSSLNEQYDKLAQEHVSMKQTLENTIEQYKKQNQKLSGEVQQLIQLCDQNINTKNSLNCLKHSINNLLAVLYYLHLNLVRNRQARRKLYLPFIQFYFQTRYALEGKDLKKKKHGLRKLRACVVVVVAIKRMQRGIGDIHSSGLIRYAQKAIQTKSKIDQLSEYLQSLLQKAIKKQKDIPQLIKQTKNIYKWNTLQNYQKLNIPINWYIQILHKQQQS